MSLEVVIAVIVVTLILQGFFAGSEIALISCDKVKMKALADKGSRSAKLVMNSFAQVERFLSTTLVGINLSLITSTIVLTFYIQEKYGAGGELYTVLILSPIIIIFGQVVPKAVFPEKEEYYCSLGNIPALDCIKDLLPDTDIRKHIHKEPAEPDREHGEHIHNP